MEELLRVWVCWAFCVPERRVISLTIYLKVDLGGSLAVASRGLFATGVSTDLNGELLLKND